MPKKGSVVLMMVLMSGCMASAQTNRSLSDLRLEIASSKREYVLYEPVFVVLKLLNPTRDELIGVGRKGSQTDLAHLWIEHGGVKVEYGSGMHGDAPLDAMTYRPGEARDWMERIYFNAKSGQLAFPQVGEYRIYSRILVGKESGPVWVDAAPIEIRITEPGLEDQQMIDFLGSSQGLVRLLSGSLARYCESEPQPECYNRVAAAVNSWPGSSYAPAVSFDLASCVYAGVVDVGPRYETAESLLKGFLERWPSDFYSGNAMQMRVISLYESGRKGDAEALLREFKERYADRKEAVAFLERKLSNSQR